jgi:branched-subunit amino acid ABC-type transport system permease component
MGIEFYLFILINGLSQGMVLFIVASGLSLVFGVLRVINFAHGSLYMIGAYLAFSLSTLLPTGSMLSFLLLMLLVPPAIALLGLSLEVTLFRKIYGKEHLMQLLLTYAVLLILDDACRLRRSWPDRSNFSGFFCRPTMRLFWRWARSSPSACGFYSIAPATAILSVRLCPIRKWSGPWG